MTASSSHDSPSEGHHGVGDPTLQRVGRAGLVLMAGKVPAATMKRLQKQVREAREGYPWETVTDAVNGVGVDDQELVRQGLRAQRDWILRGGRKDPGPGVKGAATTVLAWILGKLIFFVVYSVAVLVLLVLLKAVWDSVDIYAVVPWVRETFPNLRRGG